MEFQVCGGRADAVPERGEGDERPAVQQSFGAEARGPDQWAGHSDQAPSAIMGCSLFCGSLERLERGAADLLPLISLKNGVPRNIVSGLNIYILLLRKLGR